jgi:hypothetical protein
LIDGRHFSDVIDVRARRGANIDSDHMLVVIKVRYRISQHEATTTETFSGQSNDRRSLRQSCRVLQSWNHLAWTTNENGRRQHSGKHSGKHHRLHYTRKLAVNEWFDEECEVVNEEKNTLKAIDTQRHTRTAYNNYEQARTKERYLFRRKKRQLEEEALIEVERHRFIQNTRKFYKRLNDVRRPFEALVAMCRAKNSELLTKKDQVLSRWKEHFEQHLKMMGLDMTDHPIKST